MEKKSKKIKLNIIITIILIVIAVITIIYAIIQWKNINTDLNSIDVYVEEYNWSKVKDLINKNEYNDKFINTAYEKIINFCNIKMESTKKGDKDKKIVDLINDIDKDIPNTYKEEFNNIKRKITTYVKVNNIDNIAKENGYMYAHSYLNNVIKEYEEDKEYTDLVIEKRKGILNGAFDEAIKKAKKEMKKKNFQEVINLLSDYSLYEYTIYQNEKTTTINSIFNLAKKELIKIDEENKREEVKKKKQQGVSLGMTKQQVLDSMWGKPKDINKSIGSWGTHEQWVYGNGNYLYFENGILTSIQN